MKVFLFVLINIVVVCSEESSSIEDEFEEMKDEFDFDDWIPYDLCDNHGKEEEAKIKIVSEKCSQYFENFDQMIECAKLVHDEYFFCLESMFVESANKRKAAAYCFEAEKEEECLACIFDSLKKGWEKTHNKIVNREEDSFYSEGKNKEENQATEIANNCYQHFKNQNKVKDCGNELFGRRMWCIWNSENADYENKGFQTILSVTLKLCHQPEKEDCVRCIRETVVPEDHKENETDDLEHYIINFKTACKVVTEKCGQFIDEIDELNECVNKDDNDFFFCFDSILKKEYHKKVASDLCENFSLTDECLDCVYQNLKEGWDKMYSKSRKREAIELEVESGVDEESEEESGTDEKFEIKFIDELEEYQAILIANNCYQHFKIGEKMKVCIDKKLGERMECIWDLLLSSAEESK